MLRLKPVSYTHLIRPDDSTPTIEEEVKTAEEYKGDVVNILVCGIDYEAVSYTTSRCV